MGGQCWMAACAPHLLPLPPAVAFFGYLLNVVTTLITSTGPAAKRAEAVRQKLEVRPSRAGAEWGGALACRAPCCAAGA